MLGLWLRAGDARSAIFCGSQTTTVGWGGGRASKLTLLAVSKEEEKIPVL